MRVVYPIKNPGDDREYMVEEWLSDRLVPNVGEPLGGGELEFFVHEDEHIDLLLQRKFFAPNKNFLEYTATSNRMCTISPFFFNECDEETGIKLPASQKYTGLCYALMRWHFLNDYLEPNGYRFKTSILRGRVVEKSMAIETNEGSMQVEFYPAYQLFGFTSPESIRLDRSTHHGTVYRFPGYFLEASKLFGLLQKLLMGGRISEETTEHYFGDNLKADELIRSGPKTKFDKLIKVGNLLYEQGRIIGSPLTGSELRRLVDEEVPDGPELKITTVERARDNARQILLKTEAQRLA